MAGIGEVSAVVTIVQLGFSFATALNTYMADLSDAGDDIASLVSDIEATFGQLRDLGKLIEKNEATKIWSEDGLRNAKKCVTDCEKIIAKLRKLLKKSTASATSEKVTRDEIDVSKLERALWPLIKPQAEVRRKELQSIKQDIMIAYSSYMIQVGTDAERKKFTDDLPKLQRTRALARRQVREAKVYRQWQISRRRRRLRARTSGYVPPEPASGNDDKEVPYRGDVPGDRWSDDGGDSALDGEEPLIYQNIEDLEREFEEWKVEEDERRANLEAERKRVQEEAVETWKQQQMHELEIHRKKLEEERSSLRAELMKQRVPPQQIEDIINHVHPQERINNNLQILNLTPPSDKDSSLKSNDGVTVTTSSRRWRGWFRNKSSSSQDLPSAGTLVKESHRISIPDIIKDETAEGGIAPLKARYFQRSLRKRPVVDSFDIEIPDQWLLGSWIKRQEALAHNPKKVNSIWKEFSQLPGDYRHAINQSMHDDNNYGHGDDRGTWIMLHLECMFENHRRSIFDRRRGKEMVGVYLVMRRKKKPRYSGAEFDNLALNNDENMSPTLIENELRDSTIPQRSGKDSYEPRYSQVQSWGEPSPRTRGRRPARGRVFFERRPMRESYDLVDGEPLIILQSDQTGRQRERQRQMERERERDRDRAREWPGYGINPWFLPPDVRSQRLTRQGGGMNDGSDVRHIPKYVSFAKTPILSQGRPRKREPHSASDFVSSLPVDPDVLPSRPDSPLYNTNLTSERRAPKPRRRGSRSRSPSPRPLRRNDTDLSYRSSHPVRHPQAQSQPRSFPAYPDRRGMWPKPRPVQPQRQASIIEELSKISEISTSSEIENGDDDDNNNTSSSPRRRTRGRGRRRSRPWRETDEELLGKTLKEYINPSSIVSPAPGPAPTQDDAAGGGGGGGGTEPESESAAPVMNGEEANGSKG